MKSRRFISRSLGLVVVCILLGLAVVYTFFQTASKSPKSEPCRQTPSCPNTQSDYSNPEACSGGRTDAEAYVLHQIQTGKPVKLPLILPGIVYEELRGCFIRDLLTNATLGVPSSGVLIDNAIIRGPIDIRNAEIAPRVELTNCRFEGDLNMKRSHFLKGLSMAGSSFGTDFCGAGRLDSENAVIDFDFNLGNCDLNNWWTFLNGMRIGRDFRLDGAHFAGVADFTGTTVGGNLIGGVNGDRNVKFQNKADFESLKVGIDTSLQGAIFESYVNFGSAQFDSLNLEDSSFKDCVNFRNTKIDNFYLGHQDISRQFQKRVVIIEDMSFQYMSPEDWEQLKKFVEISRAHESDGSTGAAASNTQLYASLETLFRKHGRNDEADDIYIEGKRRERKELDWFGNYGWNLVFIPAGYLEDGLLGYGRRLARLLPVSLIFLIVGAFVFRRESDMKTIKRENAKRSNGQFRPFWYNLDVFLPFIGLGQADMWTPKDERRFKVWYKRIHIIAGHLLAPIGLAAWTGIIK